MTLEEQHSELDRRLDDRLKSLCAGITKMQEIIERQDDLIEVLEGALRKIVDWQTTPSAGSSPAAIARKALGEGKQ